MCWLLTVIEGARGAQETGWVCLGEGEMLAPVCPLLLLGHVPSEVQGIETQLLVSPELETPVRYYGGISTYVPCTINVGTCVLWGVFSPPPFSCLQFSLIWQPQMASPTATPSTSQSELH